MRTFGVLVVTIAAVVFVITRGSDSAPKETATANQAIETTTTIGTTSTTASPFLQIPSGPPSDARTMSLIRTIGGDVSPKSVDASSAGEVFAQNMMYRHSITVYDGVGNLIATIPDSVDLAKFDLAQNSTVVQGAPVEAAFTPDARDLYVTNYSMYGPGQGPEGSDTCTPSSAKAAGDTPSYVYRVDVASLSIDQVIRVGLVPKYVATAPDGRYVLVSNWCSWDLNVIDAAQGKVVATLPLPSTPRGIAVSPDSATAYVAIMGGASVVKVDLSTLTVAGSFYVGSNPRHIVVDPQGHYAYVSLNAPGEVVKVDLSDDQVVGAVHTGQECRSLAISSDGRSLYVVNYGSDSITKLRASDLSVIQTIPTAVHPIGITYDASTSNVWVAIYTGQIMIFADGADGADGKRT
jgi:YVTN family beta-propeller protein